MRTRKCCQKITSAVLCSCHPPIGDMPVATCSSVRQAVLLGHLSLDSIKSVILNSVTALPSDMNDTWLLFGIAGNDAYRSAQSQTKAELSKPELSYCPEANIRLGPLPFTFVDGSAENRLVNPVRCDSAVNFPKVFASNCIEEGTMWHAGRRLPA